MFSYRHTKLSRRGVSRGGFEDRMGDIVYFEGVQIEIGREIITDEVSGCG